KWCCLCWGEMVEVMGSRVVMEMGEKMAEKSVGKKGGKHFAVHSVLNREGELVLFVLGSDGGVCGEWCSDGDG
nr:hypothetical protein [Tanacetum cinerariifolium]